MVSISQLILSILTLFILPLALLHSILHWIYRKTIKYQKKHSSKFPLRVAVIGGGIAGCGAAWSLKRSGYDVVVYEAQANLGGSARLHTWNRYPEKPVTGLSVLAWPPGYFRNYGCLLNELDVSRARVELPFMVNNLTMKNGIYAHEMESSLKTKFKRDLEKWKKLVVFVRSVNNFFTRSTGQSLYNMSYINPMNYTPLGILIFLYGISNDFWETVIVPIHSSSFLTVNIWFVPAVIVPILNDLSL
jgi:hypothetical protein